jgi:hypothetical protein
MQDGSDVFDWSLGSGKTVTARTGPSNDHTHGTGFGHYLYIEASYRKPYDTARFDSSLHPQTEGTCVTFWYHMYGSNIGTLNVYRRERNQLGAVVWSMSSNQGNVWHVAQISIKSVLPYQLIFEAIRGVGNQGDIAIDDIRVDDSSACLPVATCDFEVDTCTWKNTWKYDDFDWERARGETVTFGTGPTVDHTLGTTYGCYMYIETSSPRKEGDRARILSVEFNNETIGCLQVWYHMKGANIGTLSVMQYQYGSGSKTLWQVSGDQGDQWRVGYVDFPETPVDYQIIIEGVRGKDYDGDIAIDDLAFNIGQVCPPPPPTVPPCIYQCSSGPLCLPQTQVCDFTKDCPDGGDEIDCGYDCTFEGNVRCGWNNTGGGSFIWKKNRGSTADPNTGPSFDHTTLTPAGSYMYVDASFGTLGTRAVYSSPWLQQSGKTCSIVTWVHMYGKDIGDFYVEHYANKRVTTLLRLKGDTGNQWNRIATVIGRHTSPFKIQVTASRSFSTQGDIAIDDITFVGCALPTPIPGNCPAGQLKCDRGSCYTKHQECDYEDDCGDYSDEKSATCTAYVGRCDFESNFCGWEQLQDDDFDWTRQTGKTASQWTGPTFDHTLNSVAGHYIYIESSRPNNWGWKARLASPTLAPTTSSCSFRFFYHMYGLHIGALTVYIRTQIGGSLTELWRFDQSKGDFYERAEVKLSVSSPFQVVIEGQIGRGWQGDIGLDDLSFSADCKIYSDVLPTAPPTLFPMTTTNPCSVGKWQCGSGQCISAFRRCDYIVNCNDGSDEVNCGACDFEQGQCDWEDASAGKYNWARNKGATSSAISGPSVDHTLGTANGYYMFIDSTQGGIFWNFARMQSPPISFAAADCRMTFWYHMTGVAIGSRLGLYLLKLKNDNSFNSRINLWTEAGDKGNQWNEVTVGTGRVRGGFKLMFEATHIYTSGDIAVDDIFFVNCSLPQPTTCAPNEFSCANAGCINNDRLCDFQDDCGDGSDEQNCGGYYPRCDFQNDMCNWKQDSDDDFNWGRNSGSTTSSGTGPSMDHTYNNASGMYLYLETSSPRKLNDTARISSIVFKPTTTGTCKLRFFYHMYGQHVNALNVYQRLVVGAPMKLIWSRKESQVDAWHRGIVTLLNNVDFQVVIEGIHGLDYQGDIGLDDISFTPQCVQDPTGVLPSIIPPTTPPINKCGVGQMACNDGECRNATDFCNFRYDCRDRSDEDNCPSVCTFENNNFCSWTNAKTGDQFDWSFGSGGTPSAGTGPSIDHTTSSKTGKYAFIESSPGRPGNKARLISPVFRQSGLTCKFSFWYHMYGNGIGDLNVYLSSNGKEMLLQDLYTNRGDQWFKSAISLPVCASEFQIIFEATIGIGISWQGDIAIDDIRFDQCAYPAPPAICPTGYFKCNSGHCVPPQLRCDYQTDCCDGSDEVPSLCNRHIRCDFENGFCNGVQLTDDDFDWRREQGSTSSVNTGPLVDHTTGRNQGWYMYIEASPRRPGDRARLAFNMGTPVGYCTIGFWYHMYGSHIGSLNVYTRSSSNGPLTSIGQISGSQGNQWRKQEVRLNMKQPFQVVIEGVIGPAWQGDIAVDDISFAPGCRLLGSSTPLPTATTLPTTPMTISSPEGCKFESGTCGWYEQGVLDQFNWERANGAMTDQNRDTAPGYDHSRGDSNGYYMYIHDFTGGQTFGKQANLHSPVYRESATDCQIRFYYYIYGQYNPSFILYIINSNGQQTPLWNFWGSSQDKWVEAKVSIGRRTQPFSLLFHARGRGLYKMAVGIDDIVFFDCGLPPATSTCDTNNRKFWCTTSRACIESNRLCDFSDNCGDGSDESRTTCSTYKKYDFESGLGDFSQGQDGVEDQFDWTRFNGSTPTIFTGPQRDHTLGTRFGFYMYIETSPKTYNERAWLTTRPFTATSNGACKMRLYYHMYGKHVNTLTVYTRKYRNGPPTRLIWQAAGDKGDVWNRLEVTLDEAANFMVIIEGKVGDYFNSDIAIDDVSFTPGCQYTSQQLPVEPIGPSTVGPGTPVTTAPHTCGADQFNCHSSGACIDKVKVCDFRNDCDDGSDEASCGKYHERNNSLTLI